MQQQTMRIEYMPLSALLSLTWDGNPKDHAITELQESLGRFGYVSPILLDETTNKILAGHGRLESLSALKASGQPAPDRVAEQDGEWLIPVVRGVHLSSDVDARAYVVADNKHVELGGWVQANLSTWLQDLQADGGSLLGTGFSEIEVNALFEKFNAENLPSEFPEYTEEIAKEVKKVTCPHCGEEFVP